MKTTKLEGLIQSLETLTDKYSESMVSFGVYEMKVKKACLLYLDKHPNSKHGADKLEMVASAENQEVRDIFLELVKLRADRKILEQAIDSFQHSISGLQSLIKFENPM